MAFSPTLLLVPFTVWLTRSKSAAKVVVLNLGQVHGIDAAGLGVLLELREWTQLNGIELRLLNVTERVHEVLEITCLNPVFAISAEADVSVSHINWSTD